MTLPNTAEYDITYTPQGWTAAVTGPEGTATGYGYDPAGRVTRVTDALGQITQSTYDRAGQALQVDWPDGGHTTTAYDLAGRPIKYTDARGKVYSSEYDLAGNLTKTTNPDLKTETRTYDNVGRLKTVTDELGRVTSWAYSTDDRETTVSDAIGVRMTIHRDAEGRVTTQADGRGIGTAFYYTPDGQVDRRVVPTGEFSYTYDNAGNVLTQEDPSGLTVAAVYDDLNRITSRSYGDGTSEALEYDQMGNLTSRTDRTGRTWTYAYDLLNRVTTTEDPAGAETTYAYDKLSRPTKITDPTGVYVKTAYDPMGRPAVVSDPADNYALTSYDLNGNPTTVTDPNGFVTTNTYDNLNRLKTVAIPPVLGTTSYAYDNVGNLLSVAVGGKTHKWEYNERDQITAHVDATNKRTTYTYDASGNQDSITRPSGLTTSYSYDSLTNLLQSVDQGTESATFSYYPGGQLHHVDQGQSETTFTYDQAGYLDTEENPLNAVTDYTYDAEGRLTTVQPPGLPTITNAYDSAGRLHTQTANGAVRTFGYDAAGRLTSADGPAPGSHVGLTYDTRGLLATSTDTAGTTTYQHDPAGNLSSIAPPVGQTLTATYNSIGEIATLRGAINLDYTYNANGWLTKRTTQTGTTNATTSFGYDNNGHITSVGALSSSLSATYDTDGNVATTAANLAGITNPDEGTTTYTRDTSGRVNSATLKSGTTQLKAATYHWDQRSNRDTTTTKIGTGPDQTTTNTYNAADQLTQSTSPAGTTDYTYNNAGQLTTVDRPGINGDTTYTYDPFGQLATAAVTGAGGNTTTTNYSYDALGRLTSRVAGAATTTYGYRATAPEPTSLATSAGATSLVRDTDNTLLAARGPSGTTSIALANPRGDLVGWGASTDAKFITTSLYDTFGTPTTTAGAGTGPGADLNIGYQSQLTDPTTGMVHMGAREYDPTTGRFTSADTYVGDLTNPVTLNRYTYGNASPPDYTDPTGHSSILANLTSWLTSHVTSWISSAYSHVTSAIMSGAQHLSASIVALSSGITTLQVKTAATFDALIGRAQGLITSWNASLKSAISKLEMPTWLRSVAGNPYIHTALDVVGMVPGIGTLADVTNGALYLINGDTSNALLCFGAAVLPVASAGLAAKYLHRAEGAADITRLAEGALTDARYIPQARGIKTAERAIEDSPEVAAAARLTPIKEPIPTTSQVARHANEELSDAANPVTRGGAGDGFAARVVEGGRPDGQTVFAGHGTYRWGAGDTVVPEGTTLHVYADFDQKIDDVLGQAIETGGEATPVHVFGPGSSIPNYVLGTPDNLTIYSGSVTVGQRTPLSELLQPNMGVCHWAACTKAR